MKWENAPTTSGFYWTKQKLKNDWYFSLVEYDDKEKTVLYFGSEQADLLEYYTPLRTLWYGPLKEPK